MIWRNDKYRMSLSSYSYALHFSSAFFFFNDTATTEIYTLSLHDALPIFTPPMVKLPENTTREELKPCRVRSEEHTSELQSHVNLVCRLLLEKKKNTTTTSGTIMTG